jgi:glycosyltransferase involved in cell wall biosynthesis
VHEVRVRREAEAASAAGWRVDVLALATDGAPRVELVGGVRVYHTPVARRRDYRLGGLLGEYGRFFVSTLVHCSRHHYDRVVVANPPDFLVFAVLGERLRGARVLLDVHDLMTDLYALRVSGRSRRLAPVLRALEFLSMMAANEVLTVHEPYAAEVGRRSLGLRRVTVVMNSADPRYFSADRSGTPRPAFAFYGSLFERNGLRDLIEAFTRVAAKNDTCELWIWGDGDAREPLIALADGAPVRTRITFSNGMRPSEEIAEMLTRAGFCVVPNLPDLHNSKALSCKLLEAAAMGVPIIAGDLPVTHWHFDDSEVLFYEAGSPAALAEAMSYALDHPEEMSEQARRARERYEREYAWGEQARRFLDVLDRT